LQGVCRLAKPPAFRETSVPRLRGILAKCSIPYSFYGIAQIRIRPDPKRGVSGVPTRILIADDHKSAIREIRTLLGANPEWEVCGEAANGQEALARANEMHPDVIVLDFAMPVMNGLMAAQEITKVQPTVPIVLNTLYSSPQVELEAKRHGIRKVVEKTRSGALVSAIRELVDKRSPRADAPSPTVEIPLAQLQSLPYKPQPQAYRQRKRSQQK
jgi:DNA-binding NarL/FixJ family response regulator